MSAIALLSVLAGVLYLWSVFYVARLLGRTPWSALLIVVALLSVGAFAGYRYVVNSAPTDAVDLVMVSCISNATQPVPLDTGPCADKVLQIQQEQEILRQLVHHKEIMEH